MPLYEFFWKTPQGHEFRVRAKPLESARNLCVIASNHSKQELEYSSIPNFDIEKFTRENIPEVVEIHGDVHISFSTGVSFEIII